MRYWVLLGALACSSSPPRLVDYTPPPDAAFVMEPDAGDVSCKLKTPEQGVCDCVEVGLVTDLPNLYFVLDRSGSMLEDNKWDTVRNVVAQTVSALGPRARVGVAVFPSTSDGCFPGVEVLAPRDGDVAPIPGQLSQTGKAVLSSTFIAANGGTPTAATLRALAPRLTALTGRTFVILATDGGPNCNAGTTCAASACIPNIEGLCQAPTNCCDFDHYGPNQCLDAQPTIDAVLALTNRGIQTYVIGVPGSARYATLLDQVASAGGTGTYFAVSGTGPAELKAALAKIAGKVSGTCTFPLARPPKDAALLNVFFDGEPITSDNWTLEGDVVKLVGAACDRVLLGEVLQVRVVEGCPTITPR